MRGVFVRRCGSRLLGSAIVVALLARCGGLGASAPPAEIRIGVVATLTGPSSETSGAGTIDGARLAVKEVNDAGGLEIAGVKHPVTLVFGDDQNNSQLAVEATRSLISKEGIVALVGPQFSANAIPVASIAEAARMPMISPMSTNPQTTAEKLYVFRAGFRDADQANAMARFAQGELKAATAGIIFDEASDYNRDMAATFKQAFEAIGGKVVAYEPYATGATDFREALRRIKASGAEVLVLPNYSADSIAQATQARELGLDQPIIGADGWTATRVAPVPAFDGAFFSQHWEVGIQSEANQAFVAAYTKAYGHEPLVTAALTYDSLRLLFTAMQREGSSDPEAIRRGLAATSGFVGVSGSISYNGSGDPLKAVIIVKIEDGKARFYQAVEP